MYVIIVGAGGVGSALAEYLIEAEHEVTVIERDPRRSAAIEERLGSVAVLGDATEHSALSEAGAERADVLIATGGEDDKNLAICQMSRTIFEVEHVMSVVNVSERVELFNRLGIEVSLDVSRILSDAFTDNLAEYTALERFDSALDYFVGISDADHESGGAE